MPGMNNLPCKALYLPLVVPGFPPNASSKVTPQFHSLSRLLSSPLLGNDPWRLLEISLHAMNTAGIIPLPTFFLPPQNHDPPSFKPQPETPLSGPVYLKSSPVDLLLQLLFLCETG